MIFGIGVDAVEIARLAKSLQNPRFVQRVFSLEEQALLAALGGSARQKSAAACFAAKEAFLKAAGTGLGGFALCEIAALRRDSGAPYYALGGTAQAFCRQNGLAAHLSLTHEAGLAVAMAVLERQG